MTINMFGIKDFLKNPKLLIAPFQGFASLLIFFHRAKPDAGDLATS